jgi:hypothetical protein
VAAEFADDCSGSVPIADRPEGKNLYELIDKGGLDADVYFCPERHGTYFGSFYLKDWPAMGNPNYTIDERLTADAGQNFLAALPAAQASVITGLVALQKNALLEMVDRRRDVATLLRQFQPGATPDSSIVLALAGRYGQAATRLGQAATESTDGQLRARASLLEGRSYLALGQFYQAEEAMPIYEYRCLHCGRRKPQFSWSAPGLA